ncbi:adenosylcobinamide-GDP ribazoletransferase [Propionigenium maris DSM 9537]|uniref:Adenosylcobinamide-GDP ribazoletransferase n=1 Tax=Propionigenium maris DSM 9537 TaxID=1123000 RepID=A0A9W6GJ79_9FUSO|nr:adenosylcobinamide-GDP ribazoletransferase [Propionigenium maris]GLI56169.1 adenosylcobinamide-GDP ribazoletransferase [Propionigenium maris DSM 9537]
MKGLMLLFQFMTRLPVPGKHDYDADEMGKSFKFFPIVGMVIGVILWGAYLVLSNYISNRYALALLVVLLEVVLTGGLHLDGLADTFDGIFSYRSKHRMLEIMRDSRLGANGALALIIGFLLKIFLLVEVGFSVLLIMPVIARLNSVVNAGVAKYARPTGMGKALVANTNGAGVAVATLLTAGFTLGVAPVLEGNIMGWLLTIPVAMILGAYFAKLMERKIGGITGDTMGAVVELTEVVVLFTAAIIF